MTKGDIEAIAQVTYEANRAFCRTIGDYNGIAWTAASQAIREMEMAKVEQALAEAPDVDHSLPPHEQRKQELFCAVMDALTTTLEIEVKEIADAAANE